jgi:hypothetical protein
MGIEQEMRAAMLTLPTRIFKDDIAAYIDMMKDKIDRVRGYDSDKMAAAFVIATMLRSQDISDNWMFECLYLSDAEFSMGNMREIVYEHLYKVRSMEYTYSTGE